MHLPGRWYTSGLFGSASGGFRWSIAFNVFNGNRGLEEFSRTKFERNDALAREISFHVTLRAITTSVRGEPALPPAPFELTDCAHAWIRVCRGLSMALVVAGQSVWT